ncbi:MAG: FkbM family methyltransferase [bacterium]|nr:FkbM family methyltransferase [bacterium]
MDVGANVGQFAIEINNFLPDASIFSFEPLKDIYEKLFKISKKIKKFKAFNVALSDLNGTKKIFRNKFSPSSSILEMADLHKEAFPFTKEVHEEEIVVKKLDDILAGEKLKPEILIKLDVQGYEDRVIQGGMETFKNAKVIITEVSFFELFKEQVFFDEIYDQLRMMGFEYKGNICTSFHPKNGLPLFADAVFVREN